MKNLLMLAACCCCFHICLWAQPGALDTTFANKGKFYAPNDNASLIWTGEAVVAQPNGKIVMVGSGIDFTVPNIQSQFAIVRLNQDGTLDSSFDGDGRMFIPFHTGEDYSYDIGTSIAVLPDQKIVVAGVSYNYRYDPVNNTFNYYDVAIAVLNPDGSFDKNFDGDGKKIIDLSALTASYISVDVASSVAVHPSGKILIAGYTRTQSGADAMFIQLNANGSFDEHFDTDGIKWIGQSESDEVINGVVFQPDGKIVGAGYTISYATYSPDVVAIRLNEDGSPDNSFSGDGFAIVHAQGEVSFGNSVALQVDKKILLGGNTQSNSTLLARLNPNGQLDNSFAEDGIQMYPHALESHFGKGGIAAAQDGKIIQTGAIYSSGPLEGGTNFEIFRYNKDGSLDQGFGQLGRAVVDFGNWSGEEIEGSNGCALQTDGKIVATGFSNGMVAVRLLTKGKLVTLDGPADQTVNALEGECVVVLENLDPIIAPAGSDEVVQYEMQGATSGTGTGSVSGKEFNFGVTSVAYTLVSNPLQRSVFNVTVTGGKPAGALDFDGIDDYVDLGYGMYPIASGKYGEYSFEAWIKVRGYTNDDGWGSWIFGNERNFNGGIQVQLDTEGFITTFRPELGFVKSSYKVPLDTWTHIAFVQSTTRLDLYVNGLFVQTLLQAPYLHLENYDRFLIGAFSSDFINFSRLFNGQMDEVRVWDYALCPAQIQQGLHCEQGYAEGLSAAFSFNQGVAACDNRNAIYLPGTGQYYSLGYLHNFALNGPGSNWVEGYITGTCAPFIPISIMCPYVETVYAEPGQCSAVVNFEVTATSDCSSNITITYSQEPGTTFPAGTTYIWVTAIDDAGNQAYCYFPVTVMETQPPELVTKDASIYLNSDGFAYLDNFLVVESATDNCGLYFVDVYPWYFDTYSLGSNIVTVTAYDQSYNSTTKYATVTVYPYTPDPTSNLEAKQRDSTASVSKKPTVKLQPVENFNAIISPNPSSNYFNLKLQSDNKVEKVNVRIVDVTGRVIETIPVQSTEGMIKFGQRYHPGMYMAEITQGQKKKVLRFIKE